MLESVFNEAEATYEPFTPEPDLAEVKGYQRKGRKGQRGELLQGLPENVIEYHLPEEEIACPACGHPRHIMSKEIHRELRIVPAEFWVDVHVQNVYSCRHCEQHRDEPNIITAPRPHRAISNSVASPSVVAHIMEQKFVMGNPLYRQEQQWERQGVHLSRQTMSTWLLYFVLCRALVGASVSSHEDPSAAAGHYPGRWDHTAGLSITFSIIESAKENGPKPFEYLEYVLNQLPNANLPGFGSVPAVVRYHSRSLQITQT